jgi:MerR family transcriptional regulator, redox-sensitive transcriptional activator SoxR
LKLTLSQVAILAEARLGMKMLTIGQVAAQAGVATSTIRYYERIGLLPAPARVSGQRRYDSHITQQLGVIRLAQHAGFSIAEIQALLHDFPADAPPSARWQQLARHKLGELDEQMRRIQAMAALLEQMMLCQCEKLEECGAQGLDIPGYATPLEQMAQESP